MSETVDPIEDLLAALNNGHLPPPAWVERWSAGGRDPVAAAWDASRDVAAMLDLLAVADRFEAIVRFRRSHCAHPTREADGERWPSCVPCVRALRVIEPTPPTLPQLLSWLEGNA